MARQRGRPSKADAPLVPWNEVDGLLVLVLEHDDEIGAVLRRLDLGQRRLPHPRVSMGEARPVAGQADEIRRELRTVAEQLYQTFVDCGRHGGGDASTGLAGSPIRWRSCVRLDGAGSGLTACPDLETMAWEQALPRRNAANGRLAQADPGSG